MAMLAVHQERLVVRAALVLGAVQHVAASLPGHLDETDLQAVQRSAAGGSLNPAVVVLGAPQLTMVLAGLLPLPALEAGIQRVIAETERALTSKPPFTYNETKRIQMQQDLQWLQLALARGAAFARLRALLAARPGDLARWSAVGQSAGGGGGGGVTAEQALYLSLREGDGGATAILGAGKSGQVSFRDPGNRSSSAAAAPAAATFAAPSEVASVVARLADLDQGLALLRRAEPAPGFMAELSNRQQGGLLDSIVAWAEASPAVAPPPLAVDCAARVAVLSSEQEGLARRVRLDAAGGAELDVLRRVAARKGRDFLSVFSPSFGDPFEGILEWNHFRECPGVWCRIVTNPPVEEVVLTVKGRQQQQQPGVAAAAAAAGPGSDGITSSSSNAGSSQAASTSSVEAVSQSALSGTSASAAPAAAAGSSAVTKEAHEADVSVGMSHAELQQLLTQLVGALHGQQPPPAGQQLGQQGQQGGLRVQLLHAGGAAARQVQARPGSSAGSGSGSASGVTASSSSGGGGGLPVLLLVAGECVAQLDQQQVASLVTVLDDLVAQMPGSFLLRAPAATIAPPHWLRRAAAVAGGAVAGALRLLALGALLAVPVAAIVRPARHHPPPPLADLAADVITPSSSANPQPPSDWQQRQPRQGQLPVNSQLTSEQLRELCDRVTIGVTERLWLPAPDAGRGGLLSGGGGLPAEAVPLSYQLVVDGDGGAVLGVRPLDEASAAAYPYLPLLGELRGGAVRAAQDRFQRALPPLLEDSQGAAEQQQQKQRKPRTPPPVELRYQPLRYRPLPAAGAAVLKLRLTPSPSQKRGCPVRRGGPTVEWLLMTPSVSGWVDADSLRVWRVPGVDGPDAGPLSTARPAVAGGAESAGGSGLQVEFTVDSPGTRASAPKPPTQP